MNDISRVGYLHVLGHTVVKKGFIVTTSRRPPVSVDPRGH